MAAAGADDEPPLGPVVGDEPVVTDRDVGRQRPVDVELAAVLEHQPGPSDVGAAPGLHDHDRVVPGGWLLVGVGVHGGEYRVDRLRRRLVPLAGDVPVPRLDAPVARRHRLATSRRPRMRNSAIPTTMRRPPVTSRSWNDSPRKSTPTATATTGTMYVTTDAVVEPSSAMTR